VIEHICHKCRRRLESPEEHAGITVDCPYCLAQVRVPGGDVFANLDVDDEPAPRKPAKREPPQREAPRRERPRREAKRYAEDDEFAGVDDENEIEPEPTPELKRRSPSQKDRKPTSAGFILLAGVAIAVVFIGGGILIWQLLSKNSAPSTEPEKTNVVEAPPPKDVALSSEEIYKRAVTSSVMIVVRLEGTPDGRNVYARGTGNVIDKKRKLISTAFHVVEGAQEIQVIFPKYDNDKALITKIDEYDPHGRDGYPAKIWKSDPSKDLAILQMEWIPKESNAIPLAASSPSQGEETHTVGGYPKESLGLWVYSHGNVREVQKSNFILSNDRRIDSWVVRTTNQVNPGDSGGGLFNKKCELVGVCCAINQRAAGVMVFIDVREVRALLDKK
jgi:serine protease Do